MRETLRIVAQIRMEIVVVSVAACHCLGTVLLNFVFL